MIDDAQNTQQNYSIDSDSTVPATATITLPTEQDSQQEEQEIERLKNERLELLQDAGYMTRSLYRSCLRSIHLLRLGNANDMTDFQEREEKQKSDRLDRRTFSFEPPVDRENELSSRALYYLAFLNESFHQEVDCLVSADPWKEDQVTRFTHLMRQGEHRRKWILGDYKFDDPFSKQWDEEFFVDWEGRAQKLIRDTYELKGWLFQKDFINNDEDDSNNDIDIDWEEDDDDDFDEEGKDSIK